ncbi:unnamed protein product [Symbiodinium sp. CCMP2456]|nr:unnamed protein product [Symbiodinium sp. CCMP2456]
MKGQEHYIRLCDLRQQEGDGPAEEIFKAKQKLQDELPADSDEAPFILKHPDLPGCKEWTLIRTFKEATLTRKDTSTKTTTLQTDAVNLDGASTRPVLTAMAHGLEIAVPGGSNGAASSAAGITRRPSSMALPVALGDQEAGSALTALPDPMDKKKKAALTNQARNKIALASTKLNEATVLQEEISQNESMSQPIRDGFLKDLQNHGRSLREARDKLSAEVDTGLGQTIQELLDDVNQKITNYVQSTNGMKKMSATRLQL